MSKIFFKRLLEETLMENEMEISEQEKEEFINSCEILTSDIYFYYNLLLNTKDRVGIMYLKEKYPNNFIINGLLENQIKFFKLNKKDNQDLYFKFCDIFIKFYGLDNNDVIETLENMTKRENRNIFCECNKERIIEYEEKYSNLVKEYKIKEQEEEEESPLI